MPTPTSLDRLLHSLRPEESIRIDSLGQVFVVSADRKVRAIGSIYKGPGLDKFVKSRSFVAPRGQAIVSFAGFGEARKAEKDLRGKELEELQRQKEVIAWARFALENGPSETYRWCGEHHHYKVVSSTDHQTQLWYEIESRVKERMVIKTGVPAMVVVSGKRHKINLVEPGWKVSDL